MIVYSITFEVRPRPGTISQWLGSDGVLILYLLSDSPYDAKRRAETILAQLPYDRSGEPVVFEHDSPDSNPGVQQAIDLCRACGLALRLALARPGTP